MKKIDQTDETNDFQIFRSSWQLTMTSPYHSSRRQKIPTIGGKLQRRRKFRLVRLYQFLVILTLSAMLASLWFISRLEISENEESIQILLNQHQHRKHGIQREIKEKPRSPYFSKRQRYVDGKKEHSSRKNESSSMMLNSLPPSLNYLGVMIDAGRHYFPPKWLFQQLQHIHDMGYNYIHFRLTDDQNFVLNFTLPRDCFGGRSSNNSTMPSMGFVARHNQEQRIHFDPHNSENESRRVVYQPEELSKFVKFAKNHYNITVIPEVNLPGHAGAWGANDCLQDIVVSCPTFACSKGYGIPLNVTHPKLPSLVKLVLENVVTIFDHPPFLHLGGDELHMSIPCLEEAGVEDPLFWLQRSVSEFEERVLEPIAKSLGYGPNQILRWENQHHKRKFSGITHYWETEPSDNSQNSFAPFVISTGLYLDVLHKDRMYGYGDFEKAKTLMTEFEDNPPLALVVGTFELGTEFWEDRNVLGRLLAIRMGVDAAFSNQKTSPTVPKPSMQQEFKLFKKDYAIKCNATFSKHESFSCEDAGWPRVEDRFFQAKWKGVWKEWRKGVCEGLTLLDESIHVNSLQEFPGLEQQANEYFWDNVLSSFDSIASSRQDLDHNHTGSKISSGSVPNVGIAIDLIQDPLGKEEFLKLLQALEPIGMNLIQITLANDFGQVVDYDSIPKSYYRPSPLEQKHANNPIGFDFYDRHRLKQMVEMANGVGIQLLPEINLATNGGGWFKTGMLMDCPHRLCEIGQGISFDVADKFDRVLPIVLATIVELFDVFSVPNDGPFLHLGSDQREEAVQGCFAEVGYASSQAHSSLRNFEKKLSESLGMAGVNSERILRWYNREKVDYPERTGKITHYTDVSEIPKDSISGSASLPYFGTVLLRDEMTVWEVYEESRRWLENSSDLLQGVVAKTDHGSIPRFDHLVAFSVGFGTVSESSSPPTTTEDFQNAFEAVCARLECNITSNNTSSYGKSTRIESKMLLQEETLAKSCADRTITSMHRKSRAPISATEL